MVLEWCQKRPDDVGDFFETHDERNAGQMENLLAHLKVDPAPIMDKYKETLLKSFPKVTHTGDHHSYAGYSKLPPPSPRSLARTTMRLAKNLVPLHYSSGIETDNNFTESLK